MNTDANTARRRALSGVVVSTKMDKTAVVAVTRYVKHPKYQKFVKQVKRYKAHDAENECREGDAVRIEECVPVSKDKRFVVIERDAKEDEEVSKEAPVTE